MALTKSFNGNVVDEVGTAIDCKVRGYHVEQNTFNDWGDTSSQFYSIDLGDGDWLTQNGSTVDTDSIILMFETTEPDPLDRKFAIYKFQMDGSDTYTQDIQLKPCMDPIATTLWDLSSSVDGTTTFVNADDGDRETYIGRINDPITVLETFTDEKNWLYAGATMYHEKQVGGVDIFADRVGIATKEYDWDETNTYVLDTTHTFTVISQTDLDKSQEVEVKLTNLKGLVTTDILKIQIRYNTPIADLTYDPTTPSVNDTFTVTGAVSDVDNRITAISWKYDDVEVANNTNLTYQWIQDLGSVFSPTGHTLNGDVTWNNGFSLATIVHQEHFNMTNLPPSFTLTKSVVGETADNHLNFTLSNLVDPDGDDTLLEARWIVEFKTPINNQWVVTQDDGYPDPISLDPKEWIFDTAGEYRITAVVKDGYGIEATQTELATFTSSSTCDGNGLIKLNTVTGNSRWQLISIPVRGKNVKEYFIDWVDAKIKTYDNTKSVTDVIERVSSYPGDLGKFLSFIPGVTPSASEGNFSLVRNDGVNINEITGFWVKILDYKTITGGDDLIFPWDMIDGL